MTSAPFKTAAIAVLLLLPVGSRVGGQTPPPPPAPPSVAPEAPPPPAPPRAEEKRRKKVDVDGDRVVVWDDGDEPDVVVEGPDGDVDADADHPRAFRFHTREHGRGYIGVRPIEMTPELRQHFGAPKDAGVLVGSVEKDGPASKAGLQVGDIVTTVDGERVESTRDLIREIRGQKEGAQVKVDVVRARAARTLTITVAKSAEDFEIGDFGKGMRNWSRAWEKAMPRVERLPDRWEMPDFDLRGLQERLKDVEQRLKELEGRLKK